MSRYNHKGFLLRDFRGELHFVCWKIFKSMAAAVTTLFFKIDLKMGGGEIWCWIEGARMLHRRALSV